MVGGALCEVSNEDLTQWSGKTNGTMEINVSNKEIFSFCLFLIAAEPSVPRTVVVVLLVVGGSSLSEHSIAFCNAVLQLYKFTSGWDPQLNQFLLDFGSTNSLRGGIQLFQ